MGGRALVVIVALAACGVEIGDPPVTETTDDGKGDGTGSGGQMPLTATAFLSRVGTQFCDENFRCKDTYPDGATGFAQRFGPNTQACYAGTTAYYKPELVEQSIAAGRVIYNVGAAQTCLAGITYPQSCAVYWQSEPQFPAACNIALLGTLADGATCVSLFDCANLGSVCDDATKLCVRQP